MLRCIIAIEENYKSLKALQNDPQEYLFMYYTRVLIGKVKQKLSRTSKDNLYRNPFRKNSIHRQGHQLCSGGTIRNLVINEGNS